MKKILIIGGAGFIGSHTVELLLAENYDVVVYDNLSTGKKTNLDLNRVKLIEADILDFSSLQKALQDVDAVLHLAALTSVPQSIQDPLRSLEVNVKGFLNVLQAIRLLQKEIRFVYASSAAVYGDAKKLPCDDAEPLPENVLSPYALEKANNERYAKLFSDLFGIKSLGLRYFNVYGLRQDPSSPYSGVISKFLSCCAENKPIKIFGDGKQSRDFIHVKDVARANLLALKNHYHGALNIATGKAETLLNLISYLEKSSHKKLSVEFEAARIGDIRESYASTALAKKHLVFQTVIALAEGIQSLL